MENIQKNPSNWFTSFDEFFGLNFLKILPDGGTGEDDRGKGLAKSDVSIFSFSWRSVSETCLEDEDGTPRDDGLLFGVDILKLFY